MHESQESTGLSPEFLSETPLTSPTDHLSYWHDHLKSWEKSGLSQAEYCRRHDLKYCHFHYWKRKLRKPSQNAIGKGVCLHTKSVAPIDKVPGGWEYKNGQQFGRKRHSSLCGWS
jgi:hypothetical protein